MLVELRSLDTVRPYDRNPRLNDSAVDAVARSITEFGFRQPIVIDKEGVIVVGHTRWKAATKLGLKEVPVHIAGELTPEQARAYRIADNSTASLSEWDTAILPVEIAELRDLGLDISILGFDDDELARIMAPPGNAGLTDPDEVPAPPDEAVTKPGDLWILGNHRLLCGDATSAEDVATLMAGQKADMCFTDPPWNVAIGGDKNPRHRQRVGLKNDNLDAGDFQEMLAGFARNCLAHVRGDLYCVLGASEWPTLDLCLRSAGFHWSATIIWQKDLFVLGRSNYHRRYEPIWYGWPKASKSTFDGGRNQDDVWHCDRPRRSNEHATMKPVALVARAICNSSPIGGSCADFFGGSGTTLLACEQQGRRAYLMELDPLYCDVILTRWAQFTNGTPILARNGEKFVPPPETAPAMAEAGREAS